ncbi:MAG: B12-binding domain-containing radical SAM protein [Candidatus Brocadiia bacterium]
MKVLLIQPVAPRQNWPNGLFVSRWVPSGLAAMAAVLKRAGHEVRVLVREEQLTRLRFDWAAGEAETARLLAEFRPGMVGFSLLTPFVQEAETLARMAKDLCGPETVTVAGGPHPTALPEATLEECPHVDLAAAGEGEATLLELAGENAGDSVHGLVRRGPGGVVRTPARPVERDLDSLPPPAWELFDMKFHTARDRWMIRWLPLRAINIRTSRGCTNRCSFCAGPLVSGPGVRLHSPGYILEQVERAVRDYGVEAVHFEDDTMGADRPRLLELCEQIRRRGLERRIRWDGCLRVDQAEPELLAAMKSAGCIQVEYGFESGSDGALRRMGKNATTEMNRRAVELTRAARLRIFANIMVGLPGETEEELKATERFVLWMKPDALCAGQLMPLPGSLIYDRLPESVRRNIGWGRFAYTGFAGWPMNLTAMPDGLARRRIREFGKYVARPMVARQVLRDSSADDRVLRRSQRRMLWRFSLRHPIRAARLL